jgi:hypothetical protein
VRSGRSSRNAIVAIVFLVFFATAPSASRGESSIALEGGAALQDGEGAVQFGARWRRGTPDRIGVSVALGLIPTYFDVEASGAVLDGGAVLPVTWGQRFELEPQLGASVLGMWAGLGGIAVGGYLGLELRTRLESNVTVGVRGTYRRVYDWDESIDLTSIVGSVAFPIGGQQ